MKEKEKVARPGRLELPTLCFEGRRSIQLSYGRSLPNFSYYNCLRYSCAACTACTTVSGMPNSLESSQGCQRFRIGFCCWDTAQNLLASATKDFLPETLQ